VTRLSASSKKQGDWIMLFSSCILVTLKFAAWRQVCRPSRAKLGLKDWANATFICTCSIFRGRSHRTIVAKMSAIFYQEAIFIVDATISKKYHHYTKFFNKIAKNYIKIFFLNW
jgi:hypothetical protein